MYKTYNNNGIFFISSDAGLQAVPSRHQQYDANMPSVLLICKAANGSWLPPTSEARSGVDQWIFSNLCEG